MKIGIVGFGYWGKILYNNIVRITEQEVELFDSGQKIGSMEKIHECSHVFVATPATTHKELVDNLLSKKINVFCEKPLVIEKPSVNCLYSMANRNKVNLFVDWTFTFNDAVNEIKRMFDSGELGKIRSVTMNRLNSGPERHDVSAKWDLASHDVSILQYVFGEFPDKITWVEKKRNPNSFQNDTCIGILEYPSFDAMIHASWEYSIKDRTCVFEFDGGVLRWDDNSNTITLNSNPIEFKSNGSPLENAINCFLGGGVDQRKITSDITEIIE